MKAQKVLRTAEFEQRARNMGITDKASIAQRVAICEGTRSSEQSGDSIRVGILYSPLFWKLLCNCC